MVTKRETVYSHQIEQGPTLPQYLIHDNAQTDEIELSDTLNRSTSAHSHKKPSLSDISPTDTRTRTCAPTERSKSFDDTCSGICGLQ